jgi:hypothetical protein
VATVDFGSGGGTSQASVDVTGQTAILSTSVPKAWIASDATAARNSVEHRMFAAVSSVTCGTVTEGVGFTVYVTTMALRVNGTFQVRWSWA